MKNKCNFLLSFLFLMICQVMGAQNISIQGTVTDPNGLPLPGVSVVEKGSQNGTQTDFDGNFTLQTQAGKLIQFSFIGMITKEAPASANKMNIVLQEEATNLQEVVVTALGIKRSKKSLGYSSQDVKSENLNSAGQTNALSSLSGNVSGIQVTAPSSMGGSSRVVIRGIGSVTGNNRPLIVVDGIPFDNSNYNSSDTQRGAGGRDYGDASADINPDDVESVTVLKGGPAAALYGSRAQNGVIMYTTKSAKKGKSEVSIKTGVTLESINISPKLQKQYGGGSTMDNLLTQEINGRIYNIAEYDVDESWGPKYDANLMYLPWNAFDAEDTANFMQEKAWVSPKNDVNSFFNTGITSNTNISMSHANDKANIRASFSNTMTEGIIPNSSLKRNTFGVNGGAKLTERLKFDGAMNYTNTNGFNRPEQGYGDNSLAQKFYQWGQRQVDMKDLSYYKLSNGTQRTWNRQSWDEGAPAYSDNAYWTIYENTSDDKRNRYYGNAKLQYNFTDNLYAVGNVYGDSYNYTVRERVAIYSQAQSKFSQSMRTISEFNYEARLHFDKRWERFSINSFVGANRKHAKSTALTGESSGGLIIPNLYNLSNSKNLAIASNYDSQNRINSVYGMVSLGFDDTFYLEVTDRNDWFSTVKKSGNYPSATGSVVFSELVGENSWMSFGKIRAGWAQVSNGADAYTNNNFYSIGTPFQDNPTYGNTATANNPNITPETKTTKELGLEMRLFNNRFGFDVTVYQEDTEDLITPLQTTGSVGNTALYVNAGELRNKGIEATVYGTPIKTDDFSWDINVNFSKNENKLMSLYQDTETLTLVQAPFSVSLLAVVGEKYGQIFGTDFVYDNNGNKIIEDDGSYAVSEQKNLGSIIPNYNMGIRNTFTYKGVKLSALLDIQKGGKYFSTTHMWGHYTGMLEETAANGIRENGIVLDGVQRDGTTNEVVLDGYDWAFNHYNGVDAQNVFDADYFKLREVTLGYSFPKKVLGEKIASLSFNLFARNLFTWGLDWKGMDPENTSYGSGNVQGLEGGSLPSTRTYGMNVEIKF